MFSSPIFVDVGLCVNSNLDEVTRLWSGPQHKVAVTVLSAVKGKATVTLTDAAADKLLEVTPKRYAE